MLLAAGCVGAELGQTERGITNGDPVTDGAFPTVVGLTTNAGTMCTGTLISPTVVMTAAHCVDPKIIKQAVEQGGGDPPDTILYSYTFARDIKSAKPEEIIEASWVEWHEKFLSNILDVLLPPPRKWNDIALIHLKEPVAEGFVQQIATPSDFGSIPAGIEHAVTGYGLTDDDDNTSAGILTEGASHLGKKGSFELIAGKGDNQQACRGDSGGPIFSDDSDMIQIGIASRINANLFPPPTEPPPCNTGLVYTRVDAYQGWIAERVDDLGEQPGEGKADQLPGDGDGMDGGCAATGRGAGAGAALVLIALGWLARPRSRRRHS